jgi:hypothetical protein
MQNFQPDAALHLESFFPAAGATIVVAPLDLNNSLTGFSQVWRHGFLRVAWAAMPNHTNPANTIVLTLVDSGDFGVTFQAGATNQPAGSTLPTISVSVPGVATTGAPAGYSDFPLLPMGRGVVGIQVAVPAGVGDISHSMLTADFYS